jgi:hypothetical protein
VCARTGAEIGAEAERLSTELALTRNALAARRGALAFHHAGRIDASRAAAAFVRLFAEPTEIARIGRSGGIVDQRDRSEHEHTKTQEQPTTHYIDSGHDDDRLARMGLTATYIAYMHRGVVST